MATKTETLTIKVSPDEKKMVQALAMEQDITVSKLLYRLLIKNFEGDQSYDNATKPEDNNN